MTEYVKPKLLSNNDHQYYAHLCGKSPREGLPCEKCPVETHINCMRDHTIRTGLEPAMARGLSEDEALKAYWEFVPEFVAWSMKHEGEDGNDATDQTRIV